MHVCYLLVLAIMPWPAIAGTLSALCGLLVCADPGRVLDGSVMLTVSAGAWLITLDLLRAFARTADDAEYAEARRLLEARAGHDRPR
jgi:uncharacterized membrane protein HdeD (DUF308 family)